MQINLVYEKLIRKILSGLNCSYFVQISLQIKSQAEIDEFWKFYTGWKKVQKQDHRKTLVCYEAGS